jgi:hypothetical protein
VPAISGSDNHDTDADLNRGINSSTVATGLEKLIERPLIFSIAMTPLRLLLTAVPIALLSSAHHLSAATLFTEDFSGYTANAAPDTSGPWGTLSGLSPTVRNEATSTVFGSPNQYGEFYDASGTQGIRAQSDAFTGASNAVTTFQFDFFEPSTGGGSTMGIGYARTGDASTDLNTAGSRARVNLGNGTISGLSSIGVNTYSLDTVYTFYMIFNDTAGSVAYGGGTLGAQSADVWLRQSGGSPYYVGTADAANTQTSAYTVGFRTFNSALQDVDVDNVTLFEGAAAVPEPSVSLLAFGLAALLLPRRRPQPGC